MVKLEDLKCFDDWYYVGDIIDMDGDGWVDKETTEQLLAEYNKQYV
jgi:hypothetical protein